MKPGYEGGIDIRRDDGTLDCSIGILGRNREVHLSVSVDGAQYGYARVGIDLSSLEAHELVGALKDAIAAAGPVGSVAPRSVSGEEKWTAAKVGHVLGERELDARS